MVSQWCLDGILVVSRWCLGGLSVASCRHRAGMCSFCGVPVCVVSVYQAFTFSVNFLHGQRWCPMSCWYRYELAEGLGL